MSLSIGSDTSRLTNATYGYALSGDLLFETNALHGVTSYAFGIDQDGHTFRTTTYPDLGQRTETYCKDGQLYQISGSATHPVRYSYFTDSVTETKLDQFGEPTSEYTTTYTDTLGRTTRIQRNSADTSFFNAKGQIDGVRP